MKPSPGMIERGLAASIVLRDSGDAARGLKPVSFTGNPRAHVEVIGEEMLAGLKVVAWQMKHRDEEEWRAPTIGRPLPFYFEHEAWTVRPLLAEASA